MSSHPPIAVPAAFFGMILGLAGLGNGWRIASRLWGLPQWIGESILALATLVWLTLLLFYIRKWLRARASALEELHDPVACGYIALIFVTTMLVAVAAAPYSQIFSLTLSVIGWSGTIIYGASVTAALWSGDRDGTTPTAVIYLPTVAGNFVSAMAAGTLGFSDLGMLFLGAGLLSWLAIESVLMHNLYTARSLPHTIRPTLGIQLAPPVVCCAAYLMVNGGVPDTLAQILFGYGLLQAGVMIRLLPWFGEQGFVPGHWAFSFGVVALPLSALRMVEHGAHGPVAFLALPLFASANLIIAYLSARTLWLLLNGRLATLAAPQR